MLNKGTNLHVDVPSVETQKLVEKDDKVKRETSKEIQKRVGELGRHIGNYDQFMQKLGGSLSTTVNHYNTAHKELKKIDKDVLKISGISANIEPQTLARPLIEE